MKALIGLLLVFCFVITGCNKENINIEENTSIEEIPECEIQNITNFEFVLFEDFTQIKNPIVNNDEITLLHNSSTVRLSNLNSNSFQINWDQEFGQSGCGTIHDLILTKNGNYIFVGQCESKNWLIKTNELGEQLIEIKNETDSLGTLNRIHELENGDLITFGSTSTFLANSPPPNLRIQKIDENLNLIWEKAISSNEYNEAYDIFPLPNDNMLLCYTWRTTSQLRSFGFLEIDSNGNIIREKKFEEYEHSLSPNISFDLTLDGSILITTKTQIMGSESSLEPIVMKISGNHEIEWQEIYDQSKSVQNLHDIKELSNGEILIIGSNKDDICQANSDIYSLYIAKLQSNGKLIWERTYGNEKNTIGSIIIESENEELIIIARQKDVDEIYFPNSVFLKIDQDGNPI